MGVMCQNLNSLQNSQGRQYPSSLQWGSQQQQLIVALQLQHYLVLTDLVIALPGNAAQQQEEGLVHPLPPLVVVHVAVPGRRVSQGPVGETQLLLVDVGHGLVRDREGQRQKLKEKC